MMRRLQGRRVLVVEDDYVIAMDIVDMLASVGAEAVGPVGWEDEAFALASDPHTQVDLAILDVDLHGAQSYRVADALLARGVPFVFTTGYSAEALDLAYRGHPRLEKPVSARALLAALAQR